MKRPDRAILLVDHGSRLAEANEQLEEIARRVERRRPDWIVRAAHMEIAAPDIPEGVASCIAAGAREIVLHPYFLAPGRHTTRDIPRLAEEARRANPEVAIHVSPPLGAHEKLVDVVLERVDSCL